MLGHEVLLLGGRVLEVSFSRGAKRAEQRLQSLEDMRDFCETVQCRRRHLLKHFGEALGGNSARQREKCCDACRQPDQVRAALLRLKAQEQRRWQPDLGVAKFHAEKRERERTAASVPHLRDLDAGPRKRIRDVRRSGKLGGWGGRGGCMGSGDEERGGGSDDGGGGSDASDSEGAARPVAPLGGMRGMGGSSFVCASSLVAASHGSGGDGSGRPAAKGGSRGLGATLDRLAQMEEEEEEAEEAAAAQAAQGRGRKGGFRSALALRPPNHLPTQPASKQANTASQQAISHPANSCCIMNTHGAS